MMRLVFSNSLHPIFAGDVLQYVLHIANTGAGTARQVVVHEPLPRGTGYVPGSASGDGQLDGEESLVTQRALRWDLGTLADQRLRIARMRAHRVFDTLWQGARVEGYGFLVELGFLGGRARLGSDNVFALIQYD